MTSALTGELDAKAGERSSSGIESSDGVNAREARPESKPRALNGKAINQ